MSYSHMRENFSVLIAFQLTSATCRILLWESRGVFNAVEAQLRITSLFAEGSSFVRLRTQLRFTTPSFNTDERLHMGIKERANTMRTQQEGMLIVGEFIDALEAQLYMTLYVLRALE